MNFVNVHMALVYYVLIIVVPNIGCNGCLLARGEGWSWAVKV
jgi:hypothetical protein